MGRTHNFRCPRCGWTGERYCNVKHCPKCKAKLTLNDATDRKEPEPAVCPTCKRPFGSTPKRVCGKCKKPMGHSDKWMVVDGSTIVHRNCEDPRSYS